MNAEIKNDTNNNDTIEQDQNPAAPATPEAASLVPPSDPSALSDSSDASEQLETPNPEPETMPATNPIIHQSNNPSVPPTNPPIQESNNPPFGSPSPSDSSEPSDQSASASATDYGQLATAQNQLTADITQRTTSKPRKRASRPRVGKVAKLPEELRNFVNEQILRGISFEYIKTVLKEKGYPGFSASNISRWKLGGYREWVLNQESAAAQQARREEALKLAREKGSDLEEATIQLALARYHSFFARVDLAAMEPQLADNPEHIIGLIRGLSHLVTANRALKQKQGVISHPERLGRPASARDLTDFESQEKNGGLTVEQRDAAAARLGIRPPPPKPPADTPKPGEPDPSLATEPLS